MNKTSIPSDHEADDASENGAPRDNNRTGDSKALEDAHTKADEADGAPDRTAGSVARLNDAFRKSFVGGAVLLTRGVVALPLSVRRRLIAAVRAFDDFHPGNDPYGEHDFGAVTLETELFFWKIDAYDLDHRCASPDPSDLEVTRRVLTVMLADEY